MWPAGVEEVAAVLRAAGVEARLEELPPGEDAFPGPAVRVEAFDCDGRSLVTLLPADRALERRKLPCAYPRPLSPPPFPFRNHVVLLERTLVSMRTVWLEAGSPRHVVGLAPSLLVALLRAETVDLVADTRARESDGGARG